MESGRKNRTLRLAYKNMIDRCYNEKNASYAGYGGRGIIVCEEWIQSEDSFLAWAEPKYSAGLWLERLDNESGYSPENCSWVTRKEQNRNQRRTRWVEYEGRRMAASAWAEEYGIRLDTFLRRLDRGIEMPRAIEKDLRSGWEHGTRTGYDLHKCRCEACRACNAERGRRIRFRHKAMQN